jgi:hypothetical protein
MKCPHCGEEFNAGKLMGSVKSARKAAASRKNGAAMRAIIQAGKAALGVVSRPMPVATDPTPDDDDVKVAPRPATLEGKKAAALAAMAKAMNPQTKPNWGEIAQPEEIRPLSEVPRSPFDVNLDGEPHRVTIFGKNLALFYIGGGEPAYTRQLAPGELETFWAQRIK